MYISLIILVLASFHSLTSVSIQPSYRFVNIFLNSDSNQTIFPFIDWLQKYISSAKELCASIDRLTEWLKRKKRKRLLINFFLIYSPWFKLYPFITLFSFLIESSLLEFMYLFTSTSDSSVFYSLHRYRYRYCKPSRHICALLEMCFYTSNKVLLLLRVHFKFVCNTAH